MIQRIFQSFVCLMFLITGFSASVQKKGAQNNPYELNASDSTVIWGNYWSENKPILKIKSGDYVKVHTLLTSNPRRLEAAGVAPEMVEKELRQVEKVTERGPGGHVLNGPIYVEGAEPGDVLEIKIKSIDLAIPYGYNAIGQSGFLSDEIFERKMRIVKLDTAKMIGLFADGIEIPLHPFFGSMGVAPPKEAGRWNSAPPWVHAGNMDNKELTEGTSLFIPVFVKGALFEIGDGHAAQGNGEVDITAIETSLRGKLQFVLHKNMKLDWPRAETATHIITMGFNRDLNAATHIALRQMIKYLMEEKNMTREDAYMLCSVAVDMDITELVDGYVGVHAMLPKNIFVGKK
ncbi:MAG: acetamidase/formamidase family protein [Gillisia sp.]